MMAFLELVLLHCLIISKWIRAAAALEAGSSPELPCFLTVASALSLQQQQVVVVVQEGATGTADDAGSSPGGEGGG